MTAASVLFASTLVPAALAQQNGLDNEAGDRATASARSPGVTLSGVVELARLVDLCAETLGLNVEYDAAALRGEVTRP